MWADLMAEKGTNGLQMKARFAISTKRFKNKWYLSEWNVALKVQGSRFT